jgi:hypothetical protein
MKDEKSVQHCTEGLRAFPVEARIASRNIDTQAALIVYATVLFFLESREERVADRRGQIPPDEGSAVREANEVAAALRRYRGESWRVIVTNEWGHEITQIPTPSKASVDHTGDTGPIRIEA